MARMPVRARERPSRDASQDGEQGGSSKDGREPRVAREGEAKGNGQSTMPEDGARDRHRAIGEGLMKSKQQKYEEAVGRNLRHLGKPAYRDVPMELCRMKLGIRKGDTAWDFEIKAQRLG